jgi:transcriptional regulator with XRE-family HTH domain
MNREKWSEPRYQRMASVKTQKDELIVEFQDGSRTTLKRDSILPPSAHSPDWKAMEFNPYEIVIPTSLGETEIPWTTIRLLTDPEFAAHWAHQAEKQAKDIGHRLRELRKSRNLTSKAVAERAGISPQSLSRIENGYHDVVFTTLRRILAAMGCTLQDLSNIKLAPPSLNTLFKRLETAGVKREWLIERILPRDLVYKAVDENTDDESLIKEVAKYISLIFGWSADQILNTQPLTIDSFIIQSAKFKTRSKIQEKQTSAYALYAHYLSLIVLQATEHLQNNPIPENPTIIRKQIANAYGTLDLKNILRYLWDNGIPVVPLADPGTFHGACWKVSGRNVIVLKQITKFQGRWLFDAVHELGHVVKHLSENNNSIIETEEISPFDDTEEEWEASEFATDLLFSGRAEEIAEMSVEVARNKVENLKSAVLQVAASEHVPVDLLANYLAFRLSKGNNINWWGTANNLQITEPSPWLIAKQMLIERMNPDSLNQEDYNLISRALNE